MKRRDRNENVFARPNELHEMLKLRFRAGDLDLLEKRKRYTSSREEEEINAQMCPCGKAIESRSHEMYKEEWDVLEEERREIDECNMEEFGTLLIDSGDKTIAILRGGAQSAKQERDKASKKFLCDVWKQRDERLTVGGVSIRNENGASSRLGCVVNDQINKASNK